MPKQQPAKPAKPTGLPADATTRNLVYILLDRSGSMMSTKAQTIAGLNSYVEALKEDKASTYELSLTQFDITSAKAELVISYEEQPLDKVPHLTTETYQPRGGTPLLDAIGETVRRVDPKGRGVIFVVVTDGQENSSTEFTRDSIRKLIAEKEADGWTFVYIGADISTYEEAGSLGVPVGATVAYHQGHEATMYTNSASATMSRAASNRVVGTRASAMMSFFSTDQKNAIENPSDLATSSVTQGLAGGGTTGSPSFPKPTTTGTSKRPRRNWNTKGDGAA